MEVEERGGGLFLIPGLNVMKRKKGGKSPPSFLLYPAKSMNNDASLSTIFL